MFDFEKKTCVRHIIGKTFSATSNRSMLIDV